MRLCDWFAGIDMNDRDVSAAIGSAQGGSPARVHAVRSFAGDSDLARDRALREIGEWLRLESGGSVGAIALTVPSDEHRALPASAECRFSEPVIVDDEMIDDVRQRALASSRLAGPVLCSAVRGFICDGRRFPEAPLGLTVRSLSINLMTWVAGPRHVRLMTRLLDDIGYVPGLIVPRVVAVAEAALDAGERDRGVTVLCVSQDVTEGVVYRNGQIDDLFAIQLGKARLDAKLAQACGVSLDLAERIDLTRMLGSAIPDPTVQRVRTLVSAWGLSLMRAVRERLEATGPVWQLRSGVVIADSARSLPLLAETAARVIGSPARVASAGEASNGEPLAVRGLIPAQWRVQAVTNESQSVPLINDPDFGDDERDTRRGIAPVIGRWLREFVPADHAP